MGAVLWLLAILDAGVLGAGLMGAGGRLVCTGHALLCLASLILVMREMARGRQVHALSVAAATAVGPLAILLAPAIGRHVAGSVRQVQRRFLEDDPVGMEDIVPLTAFGRRLTDKLEDDQIDCARPARLGSLHRYLRLGDIDQRQAAITAAVRSFDLSLTPVILHALGDRDQAVRAQAAAAAAEIAQKLVKERVMLEEQGDPRRLAAFLAAHASGNVLLSDAMRAQFRDAVERILRGLEERTRADTLRLGRTLLEAGRARDCAAEMQALVDGGEGDGAAVQLLAAALLRVRDFAGLDRLVDRHGADLPPDLLLRPSAPAERVPELAPA